MQPDQGNDGEGAGKPLDARALSVMWTKAHPIVAAYIRSTIHDFHRAEDLLQDTAATAAEKFDEFDPTRPFVPWVLGIARYKILHYLRTYSNDRHIFSEQMVSQLTAIYGELEPEFSERYVALEKCLDAVKGRARRLLKMRYVRRQTPKAIAAETGMTANAVAVVLHRVRKSLQDCIEKQLAS